MGSLHQHSVRFILSLSLSLSSLSSLSLLSPPSPSLYLSLFSPSLSLSISLYLSLSLLSLSLYLSLSISLLSLLPRTIAYILIHHTHSLALSHNRYYQSTEPSVMERHIYSISIELNNTRTKKQLSHQLVGGQPILLLSLPKARYTFYPSAETATTSRCLTPPS